MLARGRLDAIAHARCTARQTLAIVRQNQQWALFYNFAAIPLAALGLVPPWLAALGMAVSSFGVVLNTWRIGAAETGSVNARHSLLGRLA